MSDNNPVRVVEVTTKKELREFVTYPNKHYGANPNFVPSFYQDDLADWDKTKNPAMEYCDAKAFLAYRGDRIVGRIGAILSRKANEKWGTKRMRFSNVDFIDDPEVSKALFDTVEAWAVEKGCDEVHGPLGFTDLDREGMLVEGFNKRSMYVTYYNPPYYKDHMERLGYGKDIDWVEYMVPVPVPGDPTYLRIHKLARLVSKRYNYHEVKINHYWQFYPYIKKVFNLVNIAYANLYGTVDLSDRQIRKYARKFMPLVRADFISLIEDENNELVAFGVCAPSMAEALRKHNGRLMPFGWIDILKSIKKNDTVDLYLIAVHPDHRNRGLNSILMNHINESCIKHGIVQAETGPMLENNKEILSQWKMFNLEPHKRRRCFIKKVGTAAAASEAPDSATT